MGFFDDFARTPLGQRLLQHVQSQVDPYQNTIQMVQQGQLPLAALKGLQTVVTTAPKAALDTVGLGLEGSANIASAATGGGLLTLADHADQIPGLSANDKMVLQQAAAIARAGQGGPIGGLQSGMDITNYVRQHANTPLAWGTGAATMGLDLSNFLPFGKIEEPLKAAAKPVGRAVLGKLAPKVADLAPETAAKIAASGTAKKIAPEVAKALGAALENVPPAGTVNPDGSIEAAVTRLAPEVAPQAGPLKTIFGQDASVVHSGTYPGLPRAAGDATRLTPDIAPVVDNAAPAADLVPQNATQAAGLAPDATINDKMNALEQNPNLPVLQGTPAGINVFAPLFEAAYGAAKKDQRRNAIPALAKTLGATFRTDGTFWRNGVDVSQVAYDFLRQRATLGDDRKAIAAARDVAKQAADQLAGDAGGGLPGAALAAPAPAADLPAGKLGSLPPDNYRKPLTQYTDQLYHDTGVDGALTILDPGHFASSPHDVFFSNTPDLATGQGGHTGILLQIDPAAVEGQINRQKPAWQVAWDGGAAEFVDRHGVPEKLHDAVRSVTVQPQIAGTPGTRVRLRAVLTGLEQQGWVKTALPDGAMRYTRPDLAGAGGGLPGQIPVRLATTLGGAAVGAGAGYQQDGVQGALEGAAIGGLGGAGLGSVPYGTLGDLAQIGHTAGKAGFEDALQNGGFSLKGVAHDWSADKTKTVRGLALDTMTNYVRALVNKIPLADIRAARTDLIQQAKTAGTTYNAGHPYTSMTADMFDKLGQDITQYDLHQAYGQGYLGSANKYGKPLHPLASAATGAGFSLSNLSTYLTGGLGVAAGAARGAARPYTTAAFNAINDLEHNAARDAGFRAAIKDQLGQVAPAFLDQIKAAGGDITGLAADGMFSPDQAEAALPGAGATWQAVLDQVLGTPKVEAVKANAKKGIQAVEAATQQDGLASQFVKQAFGDYTDRNAAAKALSAVAPFSRYTLGQLPVAATLVAGHPGATLLVAKMLRDANQRAAQSGTPSYNADNLDVPNGTPVIGGLASLLASAPAQGSINLLNSFSPVNIDVGSLGDITDPTKSPYQKASALMNAVGLQFNPLIQAGAYVVGANDQAPGAQSRYAGLENALGGPQVPTLKGVLDNVRKAVSGQYPDSYDPVQGYIAEQVLAGTGLPISDPSNRQAAIDAQDPTSRLYIEAKAAVDRGAAAKNLLSVISPVTLTTTTDVKAQYRQAKAQDPRYTKEQIAQAAAVNPAIASQMEAVNAQIAAQDPALVTYTQPKLTADEKADPRVKAFAAQNASIQYLMPQVYAQMLAAYKRQLGIK